MRYVVFFALVLTCAALGAQVDQPWLDPSDSSTSYEGAQQVLGVLCAVVFGILGLRANGSFESAFVAAWVGGMIGLLVGWPVSCMLR